ncbi:general transcription factor II-I repeat domain-containing protein 2A-like [Hydra vulgaris]|uniref:General transcription factor II-I repeat domain-containing protein 2A-like n=1 Tax=Hydra vulgaris TaxID=6087 RepID=A0ABM4B140_HYDVU
MTSAKRRRCDTESGHGGRVFNPSWITDYFVNEQMMKTKVISSYSATEISFLMAEAIAKSGKPFCTGDLLKNCLKIFCKEICPEKTPTVEDLSLSHQTIARRVEDLSKNIELSLKEKLNKCETYSLALDESTDRGDTAHLAIFIRDITSNFEVIEELLDINHMKDTTRGEDILSKVKKTLVKFELPEKKLCGVTTDGASAVTGKNIGYITLLKKSIYHEIISYHCIIHQEQLCAKVLEMKNVMELVIHTVNFIRSRGLNHRRFKQLLEGCGKDTSLLENIDCLNDLAFLIDMTQMLMELNLKLQGKDQLISKLNINTIDSERYCTLILKLIDEFDTRFCDFKKEKNELDLFAHPFSIKAKTVRIEFQMELIELQNNKDLKKAYKEVKLLEFYKKYMSIEVFPRLCRHAINYFSLFGSTYNCEQLFSKMKHVKTEQRNRLTDEHLTNTLRIASSNIKVDIDHFCKKKQCQVSH